MITSPIPVIDIFAGPGGLGEGFSGYTVGKGQRAFRISLSIEKDATAHQTLLLRSFYRQFQHGSVPQSYYEHLRGKINLKTLFDRHPAEAERAEREAWKEELGKKSHERVKQRISTHIGNSKSWVLIGGPPCQAYSLVGRSRMKKLKKFKRDKRHYLYREYLRIIADHMPPVFVMENVKGLLSSTTGSKGIKIFERICRDLEKPEKAIYGAAANSNSERLSYRIYPLAKNDDGGDKFEPGDYVIKAEMFGVPQSRHRVILLGIRSDIQIKPKKLGAYHKSTVPIEDVISDLPALRSSVSKGGKDNVSWINALGSIKQQSWFGEVDGGLDERLWNEMSSVLNKLEGKELSRGGEFIKTEVGIERHRTWYYDKQIKGVCNHSARAHMVGDLHRYLFASCFAKVYKKSPQLKDFPTALLPKHKNVEKALKESLFSDRFRVQTYGKPASTVTSHISKDGHYYIHPDPHQCRSLTVREAARLQTFPDNYFFSGNRTAQYQQVGNAVPPYLAKQIARIVFDVLIRAMRAESTMSAEVSQHAANPVQSSQNQSTVRQLRHGTTGFPRRGKMDDSHTRSRGLYRTGLSDSISVHLRTGNPQVIEGSHYRLPPVPPLVRPGARRQRPRSRMTYPVTGITSVYRMNGRRKGRTMPERQTTSQFERGRRCRISLRQPIRQVNERFIGITAYTCMVRRTTYLNSGTPTREACAANLCSRSARYGSSRRVIREIVTSCPPMLSYLCEYRMTEARSLTLVILAKS